MVTLGELGVLIGAEVNEAGFSRAVSAIEGLETAAQRASAGASASLGQLGAAADKSAARITDANGRIRDGFGKFVSAGQLAAEAAGNVGGSLGKLSDVASSTSAGLNSGLIASFARFDKEVKPLEAGIGRLGESAKSTGQSLTLGLTLPIGLAAAGALAAFGKIDALERSINALSTQNVAKQGLTGFGAIEAAAAATKERVAELAEVAKAPGIGFEQAIKGDVRLRAVGISARDSAKDLKEFANVIASGGGGAADFDRVTVQLAQLSAKGKVLSQDLRPIIEAAPAVAQALQTLYGTIDSEDISKQLEKQGQSSSDFINVLTEELAKLPRVTGGFANQFENFQQGIAQNAARLGDSLNKAFDLEGLLGKASDFIDGLTSSFAGLDPATQKLIFGFVAVVAAVGPVLVGVGTLGAALPALIAGFGALSGVAAAVGVGVAALAGPIGLAVAAVALLVAGLYRAATAADRALGAAQDQAKETDNLTASISPLLARYTELSAKTSLTAAEQTELAAVIKQLAALVPGATTTIDAYGVATGISAAAVQEFTAALQAQKVAAAALSLPDQARKLEELSTRYQVLKKDADEFNKTGALRVVSFDAGGGSVDVYKAGSQAVLKLQGDLATANVEFLKQKQVVDELRASTRGLSEADESLAGALQSVGLSGAAGLEKTAGLLETLREKLKAVKEARETETTVGGVRVDNAQIESLEKQIKALEGTDSAGKKATDALAKLREELANLGKLDGLLGDTPTEIEQLERRISTLTGGLKTLVDAGVSTASSAFRGFVAETVGLQQALDKLQASSSLDLKPVNVKSLIPQTIGDTLPQDVARLLGDYAKQAKPFELPIAVKLNMRAILDAPNFGQVLNKELIELGRSFQQISAEADLFGGSFDAAGARADGLRGTIQNLISQGFSPQGEQLQQLSAQLRQYTIDSENARVNSESLREGAATLGDALGAAIGQVAFAGAGVGDAFKTIFAGLIDALADYAEKKGKLLIALGIADLATPGLQGVGALELAGGIGLLAAAGVGHAAAAALKSSAGGGGGSLASQPGTPSSNAGNQKQEPIKIIAEFVLRGKDLVAVARLDDYRSLRTG